MRPLLLLIALLVPAVSFAHPSDTTYCATSQGMIPGPGDLPTQCFDTLEDAEDHVRIDDGADDGYGDQVPVPSPLCALDNSCELYYEAPDTLPLPLNDHQFFGQYSSVGTPYDRICGGTGGLACPDFTSMMEDIRLHHSSVPGTISGQYTHRPTQIENEISIPQGWMVRTHWGGKRLDAATPGGITPWALNLIHDFYCLPGFGVNKSLAAWPLICERGAQSNISATNPRQSKSCPRGNPCFPDTGNKVQYDIDFQWNGTAFTRSYSSIRDFPAHARMGINWTHPYSGRLLFANSGEIWYVDEQNLIDRFHEDSGAGTDHYAADNATGMTLHPEGSGPSRTWIVDNGAERRRFNNAGYLIAIEYDDPARNVTLEFCPAPESDPDEPDYDHPCKIRDALYKVRNALGRELIFDYADGSSEEVPDGYNDYGISGGTYWEFGHPDLASGLFGKLVAVIADGQPMVAYDYDALGRLTHADYFGGGTREYHYAETDHLCKLGDGSATSTCPSHGFLHHLTGITDENGVRYAHFTYDERGRATSTSYDADPASNATTEVDRYSFEYLSDSTIVTYPSGMQETLELGDQMFAKPDEQVTSRGTKTYTYDGSNRRTAVVDERGVRTEYTFGDGDKVTERIEAEGTPEQRTIETDWDLVYNKPAERRVKDAMDTLVAKQVWTYNGRGQVLTRTMIDPVTDDERTTTLAYCESSDVSAPASTCPILGLLKSIDGPRTDVSDVTTYTYYASTDESGCATNSTCRKLGDLWKVTNALGHVTETLRYDRMGRALAVRDANGIDTTFTYDAKSNVVTRTIDGAMTTYAYDDTYQMTRITDPDGAYTAYEYDGAHRLVAIEDNGGNRIEYTLDAAGNYTDEETRDAEDVLKRTLSRTYDDLNRIEELLDAQDRATEFEYDENGNQTAVVDAANTRNASTYDPLNRLIESLRDVGGIAATTAYVYDANDRLREVVDPKGLSTEYTYDGLGNLTELDSPDTGVTTYEYNLAGNRIQQTDARSVVTDFAYDELGRLLSIEYPTSALDVAFAYDQPDGTTGCSGSKPLGRLTTMTDGSGSTTYCYDTHGQVTKKTQVTNSTALSVEYRHSDGDRLEGITMPSGIDVEYGRDAQGQITSITIDGTPLITDIDYLPFGPISRIAYAGGHVQVRAYDQNYWVTAVRGEAAGSWGVGFTRDEIGNVVALHEPTEADVSDLDDESELLIGDPAETYTYDALSRLTGVFDHDSTLIESYTYDDTGNRLTKSYLSADDGQGDDNDDSDVPRTLVSPVSSSGVTETYTYGGASHRMTAVNGITRTYDASGNTTQLTNVAGAFTLTYGDHNRLVEVHSGVTQLGAYAYNGRNERVRKTSGSTDLMFVYDESSRLLGEYMSSGVVREYVWVNMMPVAVVVGGLRYGIESDHLEAPRRAFDLESYSSVWEWNFESNSFGERLPGRSGANDSGVSIAQPLRYQGQYADDEIGLSYNHFRYYEPGVGRYAESDPIGLKGGLSTYAYAYSSPLRNVDPTGLLIPGGSCISRGYDDEIAAAQRVIEKKMEECEGKCASGGGSCMKCEDVDKLKIKLASSGVDCTPGNYRGDCAEGELGGWRIELFPNAHNEASCYCLEGTIFHELLHNIGYNHPGDPTDDNYGLDPNDETNKTTKACFPCSVPRK